MYTNPLTKKQIDDAFTVACAAMEDDQKKHLDILQLLYEWFYAGVKFREQFNEDALEENQSETNIIQLTHHRPRKNK